MLSMEGVSLAPALRGNKPAERTLFWEHEGNRAVRSGRWKVVAVGPDGRWELYDMQTDRTELHDLSGKYPKRVKEMAAAWAKWARRTNAIPWMWTPQYEATSASRNPAADLSAGAAAPAPDAS